MNRPKERTVVKFIVAYIGENILRYRLILGLRQCNNNDFK